MKEEADTEINGHPWKVEKCGWAAAGQEAAYLVKVAQRLQPVAVAPRLQRKTNHSVEHPEPQRLVEIATDANTDPVSDQIEPPLKHVKHHCQRHKCDQCGDAAARQDT